MSTRLFKLLMGSSTKELFSIVIINRVNRHDSARALDARYFT